MAHRSPISCVGSRARCAAISVVTSRSALPGPRPRSSSSSPSCSSPSVLLMITAALIANADVLLSGF